jgi:hypothetical protein
LKRYLAALGAALLLAVALAAPVAASERHGSCAGFGAITAGLAPGGALGELVSSFAPTGPGVISGIISAEHGMYCAAS